MDFSKWFYYDESSPSYLRNKIDRLGGKDFKSPVAKAGEVSGAKMFDGYWAVRLHNRMYKAHRVVWELFHGVIPNGKCIDHIDGDRSNNSLENLRVVNYSQNSRNREFSPTETNPMSGVALYQCRQKGRDYFYWRVSVLPKLGKRQFDFSVLKLGYTGAKELAMDFRDLYNSLSGDFSERHMESLRNFDLWEE